MNCFCCGQEVAATDCARCASGHARVGVLEFVWDGFVAKRVEVGWCAKCDFVWLVGYDGTRQPVCRDCRERLLSMQVGDIPGARIAA